VPDEDPSPLPWVGPESLVPLDVDVCPALAASTTPENRRVEAIR
jgi:hypothetical protein